MSLYAIPPTLITKRSVLVGELSRKLERRKCRTKVNDKFERWWNELRNGDGEVSTLVLPNSKMTCTMIAPGYCVYLKSVSK